MAKKIKSYDLESMQREKQKLMQECAEYENKLLGHIDTLRNNPLRMAMNSILPFGDKAKNGIMQGLDILNGTILPVILGATLKKGKDNWTKNLLQMGQAVMIAWSFKFFKKVFTKKKDEAVSSDEAVRD